MQQDITYATPHEEPTVDEVAKILRIKTPDKNLRKAQMKNEIMKMNRFIRELMPFW